MPAGGGERERVPGEEEKKERPREVGRAALRRRKSSSASSGAEAREREEREGPEGGWEAEHGGAGREREEARREGEWRVLWELRLFMRESSSL